LGSQCFIGSNDQSRPLYLFDDLGHGKSLTGTGDAKQHLFLAAGVDPVSQHIYSPWLVTGRLEI
jgi:hypothetical protein